MLVGRGMIASSFTKYRSDPGVLVFAAGVANSNETGEAAFHREAQALNEHIDGFSGLVVYFGSLFDPSREDTPYAKHKRAMRDIVVRAAKRHLIFLLPQVVGDSGNPNTLTQYLADRIRTGTPFKVQRRATRILLDSQDMATICDHFIADRMLWGQTITVAPPPAISVHAIVQALERLIGRDGNYELIDGGEPFPYESPEIDSLGRRLGVPFGPDYYEHVLGKHYGQR